MDMAEQSMNSDHMYGVKGSMVKSKSAAMAVVTSDNGTPGSKDVVVLPAASSAASDNPPAKKLKTGNSQPE